MSIHRSPMIRNYLALLALPLVFAHFSAVGGVIRHDVADSQYTSLANQSPFSGVGDMIINGNTRCSGTVIGSNWVLTAAHCVDGSTNRIDFRVGDDNFTGSHWIVHENWDGSLANGWDIALVQFDETITGVEIAELYSPDLLLQHGAEFGSVGTNVGYGRSGTGQTGDTVASGTKRAGNNVIDTIWYFGSGTPFGLLQDFDNPLSPSESYSGGKTPLALEYLIASGDSGGGLFIEKNGYHYLAGVHSAVAAWDGSADSDYGDLSLSTRVADVYDWIDSNAGISAPVSSNNDNNIPNPGSLTLIGLGLILFPRRRHREMTGFQRKT